MGSSDRSKPRTRQLSLPAAPERLHRNADEAIAVLKAMASHNRLLLLCGIRSRQSIASSILIDSRAADQCNNRIPVPEGIC